MAGFCVYPPPLAYSQRTLITVFAVASQVEEIVVDGDLSDWSGDLPRNPRKASRLLEALLRRARKHPPILTRAVHRGSRGTYLSEEHAARVRCALQGAKPYRLQLLDQVFCSQNPAKSSSMG